MDMEDRIKRYLDKVVDFLVEDTKVDREYRMIFFPFTYKRSLRQGNNNLKPFHRLLFDTYVPMDGFIEYIDESFGITSEEGIVYVWETYKDVMRDIVFGKEDINESVDSKKIYLDKIVQYIIDDTVIDYDEGEIKYPYYSNILLINSDGRLPFSVHSFRPFSIYCNDMYGLGIEEIQYVWKEYTNKLIGGEYINESMDKISKGEYLDKIVDYLVDDTMVDQKNKVWYPPFPTDHAKPTFNHFYGLIPMTDHLELKFLIGNSYVGNFFNYCKDTYGLTDDVEISKVWKRYLKVLTPKINGFSIINGIPTINESVDRRDEYLNKIVEYLVDDTIIDFKENNIRFPFQPLSPSPISPFPLPPPSPYLFSSSTFSKYCKDMYGLTENEMDYVWGRYKNIILDKINNKGNINESMGKISRVDYLNKIVEYLVDDTIVDFKKNEIRYPFLSPSSSYSLHFPPSFPFLSLLIFSKYIKDNYGLTNDEIDYVWKEYKNIILYKINNSGSINESIDRRDEYLNKIVDFLVDDTEMVYDIKVIRYPHLPNHPQFFSFSRFFLFNSHPSFSKYIKDNYSLNDEEIDYVWEEYKNIINEKTKP